MTFRSSGGPEIPRAVAIDAMARTWVSAYQAGHSDTVEACYTDPEPDQEALAEHLDDAAEAAGMVIPSDPDATLLAAANRALHGQLDAQRSMVLTLGVERAELRAEVERLRRVLAVEQGVELDAVGTLAAHARGEVGHAYLGRCPDTVEGADARDPDCPVCRALLTLEADDG